MTAIPNGITMRPMATRNPSEGSDRLARELKKRGWKQEDLKRALGLSRGQVSRWLSGARVPEIAAAVRMEKLLGIPVASWTRPTKGPRAAQKAA